MTDLISDFRDPAQRRRAQAVIRERLADGRKQDECRYLMRFSWQLLMTYQEVTMRELRAHVGTEELQVVEVLVDAIGRSPVDIDAWILLTEGTFPVIEDRGYAAGR